MAYKSRVSQNQYFGATFAGQARTARGTDATDLINTLKEISPDLDKIATTFVEDKREKAKTTIEGLLVNKDINTVRDEILAGKHPELSNQYVQKTVNFHSGKAEAAETITKITENKNQYNFKNGDNLSGFYKKFLPDFTGKDGSYALGFASVFNEYKAEEAIKDGAARAEWAQEQKITQGSSIILSSSPEKRMEKLNALAINMPPREGDNKINSLFVNEELNDVLIQSANTLYDRATTPEEIDEALLLLTSPRKKDANGKVIIKSLASTNRADVAALEGKLQLRRIALENQRRADIEFQIKEKKNDIWLRADKKDEQGNKPSLLELDKLAEEYRQTDPSDISGYQNFIAWYSTAEKDKVIADPKVVSQFRLSIARGEFLGDSEEMFKAYKELNIPGAPSDWLAKWQQRENVTTGKAIFDSDTNYVSQKNTLKILLKDKYAISASEGVEGVNLYETAFENARDWMDEQIIEQEEAWKTDGKIATPKERRQLAKELRQEAFELFSPNEDGDVPTEAPSIEEVRQSDMQLEMENELAQEEEARRQAVLNTVAYQTDSGDGTLIPTTLGEAISNITSNIQEAGKQELRKPVFTGVIKAKDGKTAEQVAFEKIQVPIITKFVRQVLGNNFNADFLAALPQQDFNNIVTQITNAFNLVKTIPENLSEEKRIELERANREAYENIISIITNVAGE